MSPRRARRREDEPRPLRTDAEPISESGPDGEWVIRSITAGAAVKTYRCPGCDHEIREAVPHLVAWRVGEEDHRRHWHRTCWEARLRRAVNRRRG
jgi:hypothetical protein